MVPPAGGLAIRTFDPDFVVVVPTLWSPFRGWLLLSCLSRRRCSFL